MTTFNRTMVAGERLPFQLDVSGRAVSEWTPNSIYEADTLIRPTDANETGFIYQNPDEGQSGANEPSWVATEGSNTQDGSLTWTALVPPSSEDVIASVSWVQVVQPDGALLINGQSFTDLLATAFFAGGTSGQSYTINGQVTMLSGAIYIAQIVLTVQ
jgi:hypothetical protein